MVSIPRPAALLGWAGVLPFGALTAAAGLGAPLPLDPRTALLAYGASILAFMAGVQWGVAMRAPDGSDRMWRGYAISVLPALLAAGALLAPARGGLVALVAGFLALLAYDLWTVRCGLAPPWYGRLRVQLTAAVVLLLLVATAT